MRTLAVVCVVAGMTGCMSPYPTATRLTNEVVPAVEFSRAMNSGQKSGDFSIFNVGQQTFDPPEVAAAKRAQQEQLLALDPQARARLDQTLQPPQLPVQQFQGDRRYLSQGWTYQKSMENPDNRLPEQQYAMAMQPAAYTPPASSAPYYNGQMTANPSLWPDETQSNSLFRDLRAYQPMDIVTIILNEKSEGRKKAETDTENKFSFLAAIENFFGEETKWGSNNESLDPSNLINASTNSKYEGSGETKREGKLTAKISGVVLEVLPNGLLRIEGTKIVSVDHEEEIMVISGLARPKDVDAVNQIDSSRIANMRVDFYGRGVVGESTFPGWFSRVLRYFWPF